MHGDSAVLEDRLAQQGLRERTHDKDIKIASISIGSYVKTKNELENTPK